MLPLHFAAKTSLTLAGQDLVHTHLAHVLERVIICFYFLLTLAALLLAVTTSASDIVFSTIGSRSFNRVSLSTVTSLCHNCFGHQRKLSLQRCPHSEGQLQSECSDWFPITLVLHQEWPYIESLHKEKLLYHKSGR